MAKVEIEHKDESKFPCFGIMQYSSGMLVVEFSQERVGVVVLDTRISPDFNSGHCSDKWSKLSYWDIVTKEFTLKFTV